MMDSPGYPRLFGSYALLRPLAEERSSGVYLSLTGPKGEETLCVVKVRMRVERPLTGIDVLRHPGIAMVIDHGQVQDDAYLATEHIEGRDLLAVWNRCAERRTAIPIGVACAIVIDLLAGLGRVHQAGRVYGLLCPAKVMVTFDGQVKLLDFQLAPSFANSARMVSRTAIGRPGYLAPEQLAGDRPTVASDLFSAGILLWELVVGRPLFPRRGWATDGVLSREHVLASYEKMAAAGTTKPSQANRRLPPELDEIIARALATSPEARYGNADQLRSDLTRVLAPHPFARASLGPFLQGIYDPEILSERRKLDPLIEKGRVLLDRLPRKARVRPEIGPLEAAPSAPALPASRSGDSAVRPGRRVIGHRGAIWAFGSGAAVVVLASLLGGIGWLRSLDGRARARLNENPPPTTTAGDNGPIAVKTREPSPSVREPDPAVAALTTPADVRPAVTSHPASPIPSSVEPNPVTSVPVGAASKLAAASEENPQGVGRPRRRHHSDRSAVAAEGDAETVAWLMRKAQDEFNRGDPRAALVNARKAVDKGGGVSALMLVADTHVVLARRQQDQTARTDELRKALALYDEILKREPGDNTATGARKYVRSLLGEVD